MKVKVNEFNQFQVTTEQKPPKMDINMHILVCTSLRPSPRTRTFCRDLAASSSTFQYIVRGKSNILSLMSYAHMSGTHRLWLVSSSHGNPKTITFYDVSKSPPAKIGYLVIKGVALRREIGNLYPKSTRMRPLILIPPEDNSLKDLYSLMKQALPSTTPSEALCTYLRIERPSDTGATLLFIESQTGLFCGPKISIGDYRWLNATSPQP
ncbi:MAG: hypothetical protein HA492_02130 [Candidatus Verstraetearchaeota archaeon]|nr:hypothetical protein [Candidatus Verstraetearchaeota archaeon]